MKPLFYAFAAIGLPSPCNGPDARLPITLKPPKTALTQAPAIPAAFTDQPNRSTTMTKSTVTPICKYRYMRLTRIIHHVYVSVERMAGHTDADIQAGISAAAKAFFAGDSGATAVETGRNRARDLIKQRREEQSNVIRLSALRNQHAQPTFI